MTRSAGRRWRADSTRKNHTQSPPAFDHPLAGRYASAEMVRIWSPQNRYTTWRKVWLAAARAQHQLGLPVSADQLRDLAAALDRIDFAAVAEYERKTRHEVVAHLRAYADAAPSARPILHLGMTSMDVVDNADLLLMREALELLEGRLKAALRHLARFARRYADLPTLGFTHLQPAQPTTVGKRATLWLDDLLRSFQTIAGVRRNLACRGLRGATGTQASFLSLLGSPAKVRRLETLFARELGFVRCYPVTGQTYSRQVDIEVLSALGMLAAATHKCCTDLRLLAMLQEIEEPFEAEQVGSSAMPYKRNPIRCERACGLARYLISLAGSAYHTLAAQMLERTLDDSSIRRLVLPEAFLAADALTLLLYNIFSGLVVYPATIKAHLAAELPFLATEEILLSAVAAGGDRQTLHELLRRHAQAATEQVKRRGGPNDLLERLRRDPAFAKVDWARVLDPRRYIGIAPQQVREYLQKVAGPALRALGRRPLPPAELRA
jgi:adenylosuccinate lyase